MRAGRSIRLGRLRWRPHWCISLAMLRSCRNLGWPGGPFWFSRAGHPSHILNRLPVSLVAPIPVGGTCLFGRVDRACGIAADAHRNRH